MKKPNVSQQSFFLGSPFLSIETETSDLRSRLHVLSTGTIQFYPEPRRRGFGVPAPRSPKHCPVCGQTIQRVDSTGDKFGAGGPFAKWS